MGVCLSRCGDAQHKAGVVAATISHQNSLEGMSKNEAAESNHSLKTFLQLYESKRSFSSPRPSLGDALHIPHSSELFSLPDSDASPARTSRASISSSPIKSTRNSFSVWNGRFSTDKTISMGCRKKLRRSAKGGEHDHQRLVEAIARLERLNNGKNLELRGSSFCRSDLESRHHHQLTKSRSGGIRGRTHHSRRELEELERALSTPRTMGNLVSMAGPIIKQRPLEKSVTNFLKEVENFVSLIEAPRLSLSSEPPVRKEEPFIITTYRAEDQAEDTDDEQFTFFEASFNCCRKSHEPPRAPAIADDPIPPSCNPKVRVLESETIQLQQKREEPKSDSAKPSTASPIEKETLSIYEDPGVVEVKRTGKADAVRPVLADVSMNIVVTPKRSPIVSKAKAPRGLRRGLSRSLDSRDQGTSTKVDFTVFRTKVAPLHNSIATADEGLIEGNGGDQVKISEGEITH